MAYLSQLLTDYVSEQHIFVRYFVKRKSAASFVQNLSNNNLGGNGIRKLAAAMTRCVQLKRLNIAGLRTFDERDLSMHFSPSLTKETD